MLDDDARFVWHPFTQAKSAAVPHLFVRGEGAKLFDDRGHAVIDAISSWWVNIHGHAHPHIAQAIAAQASQLEHVIFAGATHPPAIALAKALIEKTGPHFSRVFYSDNGSTAVEVALKIALQYWHNQTVPRRRLAAFAGGYHGDTFGAMSAGRSSAFFAPFAPWFFPVDLLPYACAPYTHDADTDEREALEALDIYLAEHGAELAACILEPLVQGAGGMRMARPEFVHAVTKRVRAVGALVIFDEVFTGFGRTGSMFAFEQTGTYPDLLCLSKGITGGFLPLAATLAPERIYAAFLADEPERALLHGHSFTANPLGCAAALASLQLFEDEATFARIAALSQVHREELARLQAACPLVSRARATGTIAAFNLALSPEMLRALTAQLYADGYFIRPLSQTIYLVPPYCLEPAELRAMYTALERRLADC